MSLLDWYIAVLAQQAEGDWRTRLVYGLVAFAAAMVVLAVALAVNDRESP